MRITRVVLRNWRNFLDVDVPVGDRLFVIGANASGKSNFLDVFRFLRDIASSDGGGLQRALRSRGGVPKIRCLSARRNPEIEVAIELEDGADGHTWEYRLGIRVQSRGNRLPFVSKEVVVRDGEKILSRPKAEDRKDSDRLTQTHLEQVNENAEFRVVARYLQDITYLHLVPQLLRHADSISGRIVESDPFGQGLLERIAATPDKTRRSRLRRIEKALAVAVSNLEELQFERDPDSGQPHLSARLRHWRPKAGRQREDQFSDGTLRLVGLMWSLLERDSLLLLEEPELSLNVEIVARLAPLIHRIQRQRNRQVFLSTHSYDLLSDEGIGGEETLLLRQEEEATRAVLVSQDEEMSSLLRSGLSVGEVVLPRARPGQLELFGKIA